MSSFAKASWILPSASAFNLLGYHTSRSLWETVLYPHERSAGKQANNILILLPKKFWSHRPTPPLLKVSPRPSGYLEHNEIKDSEQCLPQGKSLININSLVLLFLLFLASILLEHEPIKAKTSIHYSCVSSTTVSHKEMINVLLLLLILFL